MTVTYPHDRPHETHVDEPRPEPYVPVYARTRGSTRSRKGGVKTWMILAPFSRCTHDAMSSARRVLPTPASPSRMRIRGASSVVPRERCRGPPGNTSPEPEPHPRREGDGGS